MVFRFTITASLHVYRLLFWQNSIWNSCSVTLSGKVVRWDTMYDVHLPTSYMVMVSRLTPSCVMAINTQRGGDTMYTVHIAIILL
jgi:hypothetical protein